MHGVHEAETFSDATLFEAVLDLGRDVDERPAGGHVKPQLFAIAFHRINLFSLKTLDDIIGLISRAFRPFKPVNTVFSFLFFFPYTLPSTSISYTFLNGI